MKSIIYFLLFFISFTAFAQQKAIEITNKKTGKVIVYEDNQRIKVRTLNRKKYVGILKIADTQTFMVDNQSIKIDSLQSIKKYPKKLSTAKNVVLAAGLATLGTSIGTAIAGSDSSFLLFTIGSGLTIGAGVMEGINSNKSNYNWTFKIIEK